MFYSIRTCCFLSFLILIGYTSAQAALVSYTDYATWDSANGTTFTEDFNSFSSDAEFRTTSVSAGNMKITGENGSNGTATNKIDASPFAFVSSYAIDNTSYLLADLFGSQEIRIDFNTGVVSWGATFSGISDDAQRNTSINIYDASDSLLGTVLTSSDNTNREKQFYGFSLTGSFADYLVFDYSGSSNDVWGMDNVVFNVVPEPSTFLLLGGGLAGLAFYARRRKKE